MTAIVLGKESPSKRFQSLIDSFRADALIRKMGGPLTGPYGVINPHADILRVGGPAQYRVLPDHDFDYWLNKGAVFLVRASSEDHKKNVFYQVLGHNCEDKPPSLKLRSPHGTIFESKVTLTMPELYVMVAGPGGVDSIPQEILSRIQTPTPKPLEMKS